MASEASQPLQQHSEDLGFVPDHNMDTQWKLHPWGQRWQGLLGSPCQWGWQGGEAGWRQEQGAGTWGGMQGVTIKSML